MSIKFLQLPEQTNEHLPPSLVSHFPATTCMPVSQTIYELKQMKSYKIIFALIFIINIWSGHTFAHVTTARLSWHVQICDLIIVFQIKANYIGVCEAIKYLYSHSYSSFG